MIDNLVFITGNAAKAEQLGRHLNHPVEHRTLDLQEIQSLNPHEIVEHKVRQAYKITQSPVLVEDTSLTFHALGQLPGPFIKFFLHELDNPGLCNLLNGFNDRSATAHVCFGFYDGKEVRFFEGEFRGTIAGEPKGERGFGWDPIFIPEGHSKTWGEMDMEEQKATSMRAIALKELEQFLENYGK